MSVGSRSSSMDGLGFVLETDKGGDCYAIFLPPQVFCVDGVYLSVSMT